MAMINLVAMVVDTTMVTMMDPVSLVHSNTVEIKDVNTANNKEMVDITIIITNKVMANNNNTVNSSTANNKAMVNSKVTVTANSNKTTVIITKAAMVVGATVNNNTVVATTNTAVVAATKTIVVAVEEAIEAVTGEEEVVDTEITIEDAVDINKINVYFPFLCIKQQFLK